MSATNPAVQANFSLGVQFRTSAHGSGTFTSGGVMIDVTDRWWWAIALAAVGGMVGGLVYDLVLDRLGDSGLVEGIAKLKSDDQKRTYVDIGTWASVLIGGVAAIAFLYFLGPEVRTVLTEATDDKAAFTTTFREYNPFKLIPAALIVGTGGVSFVKAMRERLLKLVNETNLTALADAVKDQEKAVEAARVQGVQDGAPDLAAVAIGRIAATADLARRLRP